MEVTSPFFINLNFVPIESFDMGQFFNFLVDNFDPLTGQFQYQLLSLPVNGEYLIQGNVERPDAISFLIYGDPQYWWVLLMYNGINDVNGIATGTTISYPSLDDLEDLLFSLKADETAQQAATASS